MDLADNDENTGESVVVVGHVSAEVSVYLSCNYYECMPRGELLS